jgi:hypothetical protein
MVGECGWFACGQLMKREFHLADHASMMAMMTEFLSQQGFVNHHPCGSEGLMLDFPCCKVTVDVTSFKG